MTFCVEEQELRLSTIRSQMAHYERLNRHGTGADGSSLDAEADNKAKVTF